MSRPSCSASEQALASYPPAPGWQSTGAATQVLLLLLPVFGCKSSLQYAATPCSHCRRSAAIQSGGALYSCSHTVTVQIGAAAACWRHQEVQPRFMPTAEALPEGCWYNKRGRLHPALRFQFNPIAGREANTPFLMSHDLSNE
jgi:hypothetical protein